MSYEVTDQKDEGVFSSLSRNFEETIKEINTDDSSSDTSASNGESSSVNNLNSTSANDLDHKNQSLTSE